MKRFVALLLILVFVLPIAASAQTTTQAANPNANISWPPPVYILRGQFQIRGTANLPNMSNYFIEFRPLNADLTPQVGADIWFPAILPSQLPVQDSVLGVWDTTLITDGLYEMRLTVNVAGGTPVFHVVSPLRIENTPPPFAATATPIPTATPQLPTVTPIPTEDLTPRVTITSSPSGNMRTGDATVYNIIASLPTGTTARILGISNQGSGWYQVQLDDGRVGWVSPTIVQTAGSLNNLPRLQPPPRPTNTPTPLPTLTPVPVSQANLVAGIVELNPSGPSCAQTFNVGFDVANLGSVPTNNSGTVSLVDTRTADGSQQGSTLGGFPVLQPGQTFRVNMPLTISTWYNEQHNITLVIDPGNQIPENNEGDNVRTVTYTLAKGGCP
ncbi:MAG: SH3 domain-containing protein [Anaerolineae bacterium]|nr:SH3 domain-containing protein [Anaerolineae bacterium]